MNATVSKKYFSLVVAIFCSISVAILCAFTQTFGALYYTILSQSIVCFLAGLVVSRFYRSSLYNYLFCLPVALIFAIGFVGNVPARFIFSSEFVINVVSFGAGLNCLRVKRKNSLLLLSSWGIALIVLGFFMYPTAPSSMLSTDVKNKINLVNKNLVDKNNNKISLDSLQQKVLLIDFWFTGCKACYSKMEYIEQLNAEFKNDKDIRIISINAGGDIDSYNSFIATLTQKNWRTWQLYDEGGTFYKTYKIQSFPFEMVIKNGTIISSGAGFNPQDGVLYLKNEIALLNSLKPGIN